MTDLTEPGIDILDADIDDAVILPVREGAIAGLLRLSLGQLKNWLSNSYFGSLTGEAGSTLIVNVAEDGFDLVAPGATSRTYETPPLDTPAVAGYTWFNQGTSTAIDGDEAIVFTPQNDGSASPRAKIIASPVAPYNVYMRAEQFVLSPASVTTGVSCSHGIILRDGVNGDSIIVRTGWQRLSGDEQNLYFADIIRVTAAPAVTVQTLVRYFETPIKWIRANVTATVITFYGSTDGRNWIEIGQETIATFVGAVTEIGYAALSTEPMTVIVHQFGTTNPA